ncbi:MAG: hypothetical protein FJX75_24185, partial [Armatimonadetes bacterium]|nr:hypothetical protein [Armatimonadota bacterium]
MRGADVGHLLSMPALLLLLLVPGASDAQWPALVSEGYEADTPRVQIHGANQPYEVHALGLSTERAHGGTRSLKVDLTFRHGLDVMLCPRTDETPAVEWGGVGGPGWFTFQGLGIPLRADRKYLLSLWVWVEQASPHNPVRFAVETASDSPYGVARTQTDLPRQFPGATDGWVKVEAELSGLLLERLEASGAKVEGLRLDTVSLSCFANSPLRLTAYVDDVELQELPADAPLPADLTPRTPAPAFRRIPAVEDRFAWGVYGSLFEPGPDWYTPLDRSAGQEGARRDQTRRLAEASDWVLLDLRRHYCDTLVQGGGMLFPTEGQAARDYVKACLDQCEAYGILLCPSTYLTQHYIPDATREQCLEAMRTAVAQFGRHPALLAYWLVDEPQPSTAEDLYWGKAAMEGLDPNHPALCTCNGIPAVAEFAPTVPLLTIDYYPIGPVPKDDKGAWAVGDCVRYARKLGAKRVWVLPQVFGQSSWRPPSPAEFGIQVFSSLAEGATGFLPYAYADRPTWHNPANEYGHLVDPYGNPWPVWDQMKRLGLALRAAGPLLVGAERLPDDAAGARVNATIVSPVGRARPVAVARAFVNQAHGVKVLVVYNNTPGYRYGFQVGLAGVRAQDRALDLFSLREFPLQGDAFTVVLPPGEGRLYAIGTPESLAQVKAEVAARQVDLQADLLALETKVGRRMGTDTAPVEQAVAAAQAAAERGDWQAALAGVQAAFRRAEEQQRANAAYWPVQVAVDEVQQSLGRLNTLMGARITGQSTDFPPDAPEVKAQTEK